MRDLPPPATTVEVYLAALLDEIQGLRADLAQRQPPAAPPSPAEPVELREPLRTPPPAQPQRPGQPLTKRR